MMLFVCTGNTCRSPMAEIIYKSITGKEAHSAGINAMEGEKANDKACLVLKEQGLDLMMHKARRLTEDMVADSSVVLCMTEFQKTAVLYLLPKYSDKIMTLNEWAGIEGEVSDPFGKDEEAYRECAIKIKELIDAGCKIRG